jgi:hypothetical protein
MKPNDASSQRFISDSFSRLLEAAAELEYGTAILSLFVQNGRLFRATIQKEESIMNTDKPEGGPR